MLHSYWSIFCIYCTYCTTLKGSSIHINSFKVNSQQMYCIHSIILNIPLISELGFSHSVPIAPTHIRVGGSVITYPPMLCTHSISRTHQLISELGFSYSVPTHCSVPTALLECTHSYQSWGSVIAYPPIVLYP